jgi:ArsR family transcriptional regulator
MLTRTPVGLDAMVDTLKAAAESSRLRILLMLSRGDLTVSDLTEVLNQSQPRVSRHLKLLLDAGLISRYQEGSWAYFRLSDDEYARETVHGMVARIDLADATVERDLERLGEVKRRRQERALGYFSANAASWDRIRSLHVPDDAVEAALRKIVGKRPFQSMLDLGTGTGRLLELFSPLYVRGIGIDLSREMLAVARANLEDPAAAIREAARLLRPGGRLVIVDFAPHALEFLREEHAHLRLGFSDRQVADWLEEAGLELKDTVDFAPRGEGPRLTVKLWLAQDRRMLMAGKGGDVQAREGIA